MHRFINSQSVAMYDNPPITTGAKYLFFIGIHYIHYEGSRSFLAMSSLYSHAIFEMIISVDHLRLWLPEKIWFGNILVYLYVKKSSKGFASAGDPVH